MKLLDRFAYFLYACIKFQVKEGDRPHDSLEKLTRDSFANIIASILAMLISMVLFKIEPYRRLLFGFGIPTLGALLGLLQIVALDIYFLKRIKRHYTEERISEISGSHNFISSKTIAYISIALFIVLCSVLLLMLILLTASALANKPLKIG